MLNHETAIAKLITKIPIINVAITFFFQIAKLDAEMKMINVKRIPAAKEPMPKAEPNASAKPIMSIVAKYKKKERLIIAYASYVPPSALVIAAQTIPKNPSIIAA
jgi:hypothetical protein